MTPEPKPNPDDEIPVLPDGSIEGTPVDGKADPLNELMDPVVEIEPKPNGD